MFGLTDSGSCETVSGNVGKTGVESIGLCSCGGFEIDCSWCPVNSELVRIGPSWANKTMFVTATCRIAYLVE